MRTVTRLNAAGPWSQQPTFSDEGHGCAVQIDEKKIDEIFSPLNQCHLPGVAVGIAVNGAPVYRKGFGLANMELPVVLTPTIRMRIASISKHFTALAYLLLCEQRRAAIDDPVSKYLPELHPVAHAVTMRQLMGNISGLRDVHDILTSFSGFGRRVSVEERFSLYRSIDDFNAPPGEAYCYNNGGWLLMTVAIERIADQALEEVLRTRIFEPIGMYQTLLRRVDTDFVPNSAASHMMNTQGAYEKREESNLFATPMSGEGGIVSTIDDMLRWMAHMDHPTVGSEATWAAIKTPLALANKSSTGYGLGLATGQHRGVATLSHPGGGTGTNAHMVKVPSLRLDVIVMSNRHDVSSAVLATRILDTCISGLDVAQPKRATAALAGTFRSPKTERIVQFSSSATVAWIAEGQQVVSIDGMDMQVDADVQGVLWVAGVFEAKQSITLIGEPLAPTMIRLSDFGNLDELWPVLVPERADSSAIQGRYRSEITGTDLVIAATEGGVLLQTTGRFGTAAYRLECLTAGIWRARSTKVAFKGGILSFDRDNAAFRFTSHYTKALSFRRTG